MKHEYDPFIRGEFPVGVRTFHATDTARNRRFPCEIWYPAVPNDTDQNDVFTVAPSNDSRSQMAVRDAAARIGTYPLIVFSHHSGGHRRSATFLCTHLSSHGYVVAALDHTEVVVPELARKDGETAEQRSARAEGWIASRVPDIRFLLDHLLGSEANIDPTQVAIVGHSFGGWTALAVPEVDSRVRAVVALAPGGASNPKPGIIRAKLTFTWGRDVPTLYLVAENDVPLPLHGMYELFERTRATKQMVILKRADHLHFIDNVEQMHETLRAMPVSGEAAWMVQEMKPIAELCSGDQAHLFLRGLTLCHMDAFLKRHEDAKRFLDGDVEGELADRGVDAIVYKP